MDYQKAHDPKYEGNHNKEGDYKKTQAGIGKEVQTLRIT